MSILTPQALAHTFGVTTHMKPIAIQGKNPGLELANAFSVEPCRVTKKNLEHKEAGSNKNMDKINLQQKLGLIKDHWNPHIAGELNGQYVKLVKFQGPFTWHHHENEDELFMVVKGRFRMDYLDEKSVEQQVWIDEGEIIIVPRMMEHRPFAEEECEVLLFEPASTLNTGTVDNEFTRRNLSKI